MLSAETVGVGKEHSKGKATMVGASRPLPSFRSQFSTTKRYPGSPVWIGPPYTPQRFRGWETSRAVTTLH
jgi:hypothetical protein